MLNRYQKPDFATLCRHYAGEASSTENELVVSWRDESESNQQRYQQFRKVWALSYDVPAEKLDFNPDTVWKETAVRFYSRSILEKAREIQQQETKPAPKVIPLQRWKYAIAATVALLLVSFGAYKYITYNPTITVMADATSTKEVTLADGTKVLLNKNAVLQFPSRFEGDHRDVALQGDAIFEVAKNPKMPFRVDAGQSLIEVLGTIFRLKAAEKSTEVAVKEGKVSLADKANQQNTTKLGAGQKAALAGGKIEVRLFDPNDFALASGTLVFEHATLATIFATLENYYEKKIQVKLADPSLLQNCTMNVTLDNSWEHTLETLQLMLMLQYDTTSDGIVIRSLVCGLDGQTKKTPSVSSR